MVAPALDVRYIVGGAGLVTQGLALAWGEQRFAERSEDPVDTALAELVPRWIWRAYHTAIDAAPTWAQRVRLKLGPMGKQIARFLDLNLAYSPFPWEELASAFGMSRRNVLRKVLESLGVPPGNLLAGMRLDRARRCPDEGPRALRQAEGRAARGSLALRHHEHRRAVAGGVAGRRGRDGAGHHAEDARRRREHVHARHRRQCGRYALRRRRCGGRGGRCGGRCASGEPGARCLCDRDRWRRANVQRR